MFAKAIIVGALAALAVAQSSTLTFTNVPDDITVGEPEVISYTATDLSTPVTILLRQGASTNLQTVATLTTSATGGKYTWTPSTSLPNAENYALQITQGDQTNYFGPFGISGSSASSSAMSSSMPMSSYAAPMTSSSMMASASPMASMNATSSPTTMIPYGTVGTVGTASAGTGAAMPRNTTMSMASLSSAYGGVMGTGAMTSSGAMPSSTVETSLNSGSVKMASGALVAAMGVLAVYLS